MHTSRTVFALCLLWSSAVFAQGTAPAQSGAAAAPPESTVSDERRAEASAHFRRGVDLFHEGAFRPALVEFQRAYDIVPDYRLLYNIGQTKLQIQDYLGAAQSYEAYLANGGSDVPPERRTQVENALNSLRQRVGRVGFVVNREGADIFLDDVQVGVSPMTSPVLANVGRHRVLARAHDGTYATSFVEVAGGDVTEVKLTLAKPVLGSKEAATAGVLAERPVQRSWSAQRKAAVATWGFGGAALIAGGALGAITKSEDDELQKLLDSPAANAESSKAQRDSVRMLALSTDILLGVGAAAVVTGTVLWLLDDGDEQKPAPKRARGRNVQLQVGVTSLGLHAQF